MTTKPETKPESAIERVGKHFEADTAEHEMTILLDQGLHRHVRFAPKGGSSYWYDLITVPNALIFRGGYESLVFSRERDMFGFFRSNPDRLTMRISPDYWAEKLTSHRDAVKSYSQDMLNQVVAEHLETAEQDWPGVTAAWNAQVDDEDGLGFEETARQALNDFEFGAKNVATCPCGARIEVDADDFIPIDWRDQHPRGLGHPYKTSRVSGFRFDDTWEWDLKDFDHGYLWACHAIVAGVAQYDAAKARPIETVVVASGAVA